VGASRIPVPVSATRELEAAGAASAAGMPADPFFAPLASTLTILSLLQMLVIAAGAAGILLTGRNARIILILAILGGGAAARISARARQAPAAERVPGSWSRIALAIAAMGLLLFPALGFAAFVSPDFSWDGNLYHLPTIQFWAQEGKVHWVDSRFQFSEPANGYPKGAELVAFVLARGLGDGRWANALNLAFLPLAVLGIASLACRMRAAPVLALAAGSAFLLVPVNIYQSVSTYIDTAYGCCVIGFLAALLRVQGGIQAGEGIPWRDGAFLSAALGLCLAVRDTGWIPAVLMPAVLLPAGVAARRRDRRYQGMRRLLLFLVVLLGGALLVGGTWYLRNYRQTGNPLHPLEVRLGGHRIFPGRPLDAIIYLGGNRDPGDIGRGALATVLLKWLQGGRSWPLSIRGVDSRQGGIGFLWILGCVPALALLVARYSRGRSPRAPLLPGVILLAGGAGIFLATPMNWWARYTVWIYGIGLPVMAWAFQGLSGSPARSRIALVWFLLLLAVPLAEAAISAEDVVGRAYPGPRPVRISALLQPENWRWPADYLFDSTRHTLIEAILARHDAVGVGPLVSKDRSGRSNALLYGQLSEPPGFRRIVPVGDPLDDRDRENLRRYKVHYLLWDGAESPPSLEKVNGERMERAAGFWVLVLHSTAAGGAGGPPGGSGDPSRGPRIR
jgi:hypothetical protein